MVNVHKNILIVDDDINLRRALKRALSQSNYNIKEAGSVNACHEILTEFIPDLILMDIVLPDGNGVKLLSDIRENDQLSAVGILLMSGLQTDQTIISEGIKKGALHFIQKPIKINEFIDRITLIFRVQELERNKLRLEEKYNHLFNGANDIIFTLDKNDIILNLSKSFDHIYGISGTRQIGKPFSALVDENYRGIWKVNLKKVIENETITSFELMLVNAFNNFIPLDIQLTRTKNTDSGSGIILGIAKDLRTLKLLETETTDQKNRNENNKREISGWETMSDSSTQLTESTYELSALNNQDSQVFSNMLRAYKELVDLAIENRIYKLNTDNTTKQRMFANELGFLKAGPKELVKLHTKFYKTLNGTINAKKIAVYHEEARMVLLAVMGHLVTFYRNRNIH